MNALQSSEYDYLVSLIPTYQTVHDVKYAMGDFVLTTHYWAKYQGLSSLERSTLHRHFFSVCTRHIDHLVTTGGVR